MDYTVCLLFDKTEEQILLQLKDRSIYAGKWNGVGGKLEEGETIKQCALREIKEETGVNSYDIMNFVWLGDQILPCDCTYGTTEVGCRLSFWAGIVNKERVSQQPGETEELRWWDLDSILNLDIRNTLLAGDGNLLYYIYRAKQFFEERNK